MAFSFTRSFSMTLVAALLLLAAQGSEAQPTTPQPAPPVKMISKADMDCKNAFGENSEELRRAIRVGLPDIGMVIAAKAVSVDADGRLVFTTASIGLVKGPDAIGPLRGDEIVIFTEKPVCQIADLGNRRMLRVEVRGGDWTITLTPKDRVSRPTGPSSLPQSALSQEEPGANGVQRPVDVAFKFKIDPQTPVAGLLPTPLKSTAKLPPWNNEDLAKVPELAFGQPISKTLPKQKAMELTAHGMAKINHLNRTKTDGFMLAMIDLRGDLRGLPFLMGDECRTRHEQAKVFAFAAEHIRRTSGGGASKFDFADLASVVQASPNELKSAGAPQAAGEQWHRAIVAATTQIFMPEPANLRTTLAKNLATIPHVDATKALARLAIFSPEEEVRAAAIEGLKLRRERDYTDVLMQGFTYPLPAVSKRAAEALIKLERKDLLENLVQVLEAPDPRLPVTQKQAGKDVAVVRELVKVNHHRNCLLCHAPGNTDSTPEGVLKAVPLPGEPLPKPSEGGYQSTPPPTPDIVVRIDMTYLRQDFSLMMSVAEAHPWPEMQRFDFLVRTRTLTAEEAKTYEPEDEPGRLSPYHRAALFALRELTGRDTEPTAAAWRKLLKLPK